MADRNPCGNRECDQTVGANSGMDFCFTCSGQLLRDRDKLYAEIADVLRLEAEFRAYCLEHGLPDPHEK